MKKPYPIWANPYVLIVLTLVFWAGNSTVGRGMVGQLPPLSLSFWRWLLALLLLLPFAWSGLKKDAPRIRQHWKTLAFLAALSVSSYNTFLYLGLQHTTAVSASLVAAVMPVAIILLSWLVLGTRATRAQFLGVAIAFSGTTVIVTKGSLDRLSHLTFNVGDLLVLAGVICWAGYSVALVKRPDGIRPLSFLTTTIAMGLVALLPFYLWEYAQGARIVLNTATVSSLAYVAIFPSILAYTFWNHAVADLGANTAGLFVNLTPIIGAAFGVIFLGEAFAWYHGMGMGLVFLGIGVATYRNWPRRVKAR